MVRKAIVAGQFYESDFNELQEQIKQSFLHEKGPGALPIKKREKNILGIIGPHAGYFFSGAGAAWSFKEIAESKFPDTYIMIGLSHSSFRSCVSLQDWETPFGVVKVDKAFGERLVRNSRLKEDEFAHSQEHSIEVQLPFLQYVNKDYLDKLRIAPIIASPDLKYTNLAESIKKIIQDLKRKVCIIASSDFTHYGINYGYMPFTEDIKKNLYNLDNKAIEFIKKLDAYHFLEYTERTGATICGKYPIAVTIDLCKMLGAKKARLLQYYTSGDIINDYSSAVGYASIVFE